MMNLLNFAFEFISPWVYKKQNSSDKTPINYRTSLLSIVSF